MVRRSDLSVLQFRSQSSVVTKQIRVGNETLAAQKGGDKLNYHNDRLFGVNFITGIRRAQG